MRCSTKKNRLISVSSRVTHPDKYSGSVSAIAQTIGFSLLLSHLTFIPYVSAGPSGGNVVGGAGTINQSGLNTTINQTTGSMAINWDSYNLNANERVQYNMDASAISLNNILSHSGSQIHGRIDAAGTVILVNPNGVFFGPTTQINVGGLIASGLRISPTDFMNGDYIFNEVLGTDGTVINSGLINASLGGLGGGNVTLIGKQVKNEGVINAKLGAVNMAAGKQAVLTFDTQGLIGVKISREILQDELGIDPAVINSGEINAEGGSVLLTASVSREVFSQAVNTGDIEQATSVLVNADGSFSLGGGADVVNTGLLDASTSNEAQNAGQIIVIGENVTSNGLIKADAENANGGAIELHSNNTTILSENSLTTARSENNGEGGAIKVLGENVGLFDQSVVDASGANGGGEVLIGGDQQGLNKQIRNADFIYLSKNSQVKVDALKAGNGGKLITFTNDTARIYGQLSARGGSVFGNGGFIETSGLKGFEIINTPDISAVNGRYGEWLIDPYDIDIVGTSGSSMNITTANPFTASLNAILSVDLITMALTGGATVIIDTGIGGPVSSGDITFQTSLDYTGAGNATLKLNAANNIVINSFSITGSSSDSLNIEFNANSNNSSTGDVLITDSNIDTNGGNFTAKGVGFTSTRGSSSTNTIDTNGGNVSLNMTGAITLGSEIVTDGGDFTVVNSASFNNNDTNGTINVSPTASIGNVGGIVDITASGNVDLGTIVLGSSATGSGATSIIGVTSTTGDINLQRELDINDANDTSLTFNAANNIRINAKIRDSATSDLDIIDVTLNANQNGNGTGNIDLDADVDTNGGNFTADGVNFDGSGFTLDTSVGGTVDNRGNINITMSGAVILDTTTTEQGINSGDLTISATGGTITDAGDLTIQGKTTLTTSTNDITLDNNSNDFVGNIIIVSGNTVTLNDTNGISLGDAADVSTVSGNLVVTAGGNVIDNGALDVTGTTSISTSNNSITLNETSHNLQGAISLLTAGTNGADSIQLNNAASTTILGTVDSNGALTINAQGDLTLNGAVATTNQAGNDTVTTILNFGLDDVSGHVMTLSNGASIVTNTSNGETVNVNINGNNVGSTFTFVAGSSITFNNTGSGVSSLAVTGGSAIDTFNVKTGLPATINGAGGNDIINASDSTNLWSVSSAANQGTLTSADITTNFNSVESLNGGTGADTITGPNATVTWSLSGAGQGNLNNGGDLLGVGFTNMNNITGGTGNDTYNFGTSGSISGVLDGTSGTDIVNLNSLLTDVIVQVGSTINPAANLYVVNVDEVHVNGVNLNKLIAENQTNSWNITGSNLGDLNGMIFTGFANITGNDGVDEFSFSTGGGISGTIDAAGGIDVVDYSALAIVDISLANAFSGVINAETVRGNDMDSTLTGNNIDNTWTITGNNDGKVANASGTINFENFNNLTGGDKNDGFNFDAAGVIDGLIDGGLATNMDTVDMFAVTSVILVLGQDVTGIELITGNNTKEY